MTWNSHGIWCQLGPNCRRFVTWNYMEFLRESMDHIFYRGREIWRKTHWSLASLVTNASFVSFLIIYRKPQILKVFVAQLCKFRKFSYRNIYHTWLFRKTFRLFEFSRHILSNFTTFKIWLQIQMQHKILIWNKSNALAAAHGINMHHLRECFYNFMKRKIKIYNVWF